MFRPLLLLSLCLLPLLPMAGDRQAAAALPPARISGTVTGFDNQALLIGLNTRLGPRSFLLSSRTLVLLNNHSAARTDIQIGD
ncbi:MAG: hypothetical protein ACO1SX_01210, partial [Actinomycetota bacterium]